MAGIRATHLHLAAPNDANRLLLNDLTFTIPSGTFAVIVGPSGCGKSTLLKTLCGLLAPTAGEVTVAGSDPAHLRSGLPLAMGYLPQFAAFHETLTVQEVLRYAMKLRLPGAVPHEQREAWLANVISLAGLGGLLQQRIETLSGGQRRRLALAEELIGDPQILFLDELTSGLDPHAELEMMQWMARLVQQTGKTVVLVTHSITNLHQAGMVLFLNRGSLLYSGPPDGVLEYFGAENWESIYAAADHYAPFQGQGGEAQLTPEAPEVLRTAPPAGMVRQFVAVMHRQATLFFRDRGQLVLHLLLLISFPLLVAVFASSGLPAVKSLSLKIETSVVDSLVERIHYLKESFHVSALVAGLSMFQVILLTLMGANNGAREIAKERDILQKELRAGLSPLAYVWTKLVQVLFLSLLQSAWMTWFVKTKCGFPGDMGAQFLILFLATAAMSGTCLMFSALAKSPERASLMAIYLVGLQLPLSGAVLALPEWLTLITRPFIAAYWGWSGYLRTFESFRHYDVVQQSTKTTIAAYDVCWVILAFHLVVSALVTWMVLLRSKTRPSV
ncbi:ATP-binding cassette domain-containing protein [Roseimicrobium sp. ORNL1]|uniref:ATP-binding cassette domain-containing protein n=1 Tax=Roseimicrobium sp. ORNL1 TaxID=2711231 RepID=UPI0013E19463|nr:ATP-binding cassette domain-containing protein [Roseimicrobium sp. ORNL1]QIF02442.1 ATP-binding cassette domain-containing protein [Roseimicrobium sp. ORNL1]